MSPETPINPFSYLQNNARNEPQALFLETNEQAFTNVKAVATVKRIAYELRRRGVQAGQVVALEMPSALGILFTEALFHEAAVSTILPNGFSHDASLTLDWVFSTQPARAQHAAAAEKTQYVRVDSSFLAQVEINPFDIVAQQYSSNQSLARIIFSSGTTGRPKAIALSLEMVEFRAAAAHDTWMHGTPFLSLLDTSTVSGFFTVYASVRNAATVLVAGDASANIHFINKKSIASLKASPAQVATLVAELEASNQNLTSVRSVYVAGSVLPPALAARLRERTGCEVFNVYGSSEVGTVAGRFQDSDDPFDAGILTPGSVLQIVDDAGELLPEGQPGHIRYHRPLMATEYLGNPEATAHSFRQGWFYPGDIGVLGPGQTLTLQGRQSEILNAGGVKIDPVQLDLFAVAQVGVLDACSFAYEDRFGLLHIGLAMVSAEGLDVKGLIALFAAEFGGAAPQLLARVESIPRNGMGKPLRSVLALHHKQS